MLAEAFLAGLQPDLRTLLQVADLESRLAAVLHQAESPWRFRVPAPCFMRYVAERIDTDGDSSPLEVLDELHLADLYLACACSLGDADALADFQARCGGALSTVLARLRVPGDERDELLQELRRRLFVSEDGRSPLITQFRGRGRLSEWARVACLRGALKHRARQAKVLAVDEEALAVLPAVEPDPELRYLKESYRQEFRQALREALSAMPKRQRSLLRLHFFRELTVDRLGVMFHVHRSTAARWLAEARQALLERTRSALSHRLGLDDKEWPSLMRLIESRLDVTFRDLLGERD